RSCDPPLAHPPLAWHLSALDRFGNGWHSARPPHQTAGTLPALCRHSARTLARNPECNLPRPRLSWRPMQVPQLPAPAVRGTRGGRNMLLSVYTSLTDPQNPRGRFDIVMNALGNRFSRSAAAALLGLGLLLPGAAAALVTNWQCVGNLVS